MDGIQRYEKQGQLPTLERWGHSVRECQGKVTGKLRLVESTGKVLGAWDKQKQTEAEKQNMKVGRMGADSVYEGRGGECRTSLKSWAEPSRTSCCGQLGSSQDLAEGFTLQVENSCLIFKCSQYTSSSPQARSCLPVSSSA